MLQIHISVFHSYYTQFIITLSALRRGQWDIYPVFFRGTRTESGFKKVWTRKLNIGNLNLFIHQDSQLLSVWFVMLLRDGQQTGCNVVVQNSNVKVVCIAIRGEKLVMTTKSEG